jgi:nucleoside diphosphate kinase
MNTTYDGLVSLNSLVEVDDELIPLYETIPDENAKNPEEETIRKDFAEKITKISVTASQIL